MPTSRFASVQAWCTRLLPCLCLAFLVVGGCSTPPAASPNVVTGVVTFGGDAVWEGKITFLGRDNRVASSAIEADGSFRIPNAPLGKVRVAVSNHPTTSQLAVPSDADSIPGQASCVMPTRHPLDLPKRYADPSYSDLTVEIEPGEQRLDIRLVRQEDDPAFQRRDDLPAVGVEVGRVAPEVIGNDLEGESLRLSDYRGKVVALLFWGHW